MINKKIYYFITVLILFGLFFSFNSCKKPSPTEPQNSSSPSTSGATSLGTISYSPDHSREKSAELDSTAIDISTTDASGIKWDLHIPKQDFQSNTIITITPITNVKSDTTFNITNGVVFQPDGFTFSNPATLTVTVPQSSNKFVFFTFSQDGKSVELTSFSGSGSSYSIPITHFSGTAAAQVKFFNKLCAIGHEQYNMGLEEENNLLQQPLNAPVPPDIDYGCGLDASKEKLIDDYIKQLETPEDTVIKRMLGGLSTMDLAGCDTIFGGLAQASKLAERVFKKAQAAYNQYSSDNKKYPAIVKALLTTSASMQAMGASSPPDLLANLGAWAKRYYDAQLTKLTQDHDYSVIASLLSLSTQAQIFGAQVNFLSDIQGAMTFKFIINERVENIIRDNGIPPDTEQVKIQGTIDLTPYFTFPGFSFLGKGDINYVYGLTGDACQNSADNGQGGHDKIVLPQSFNRDIEVDGLNLCKQNYVSIRLDTLGSVFEQWDYGFDISGAHSCTNVGSDMQHSANATLFRDLNNFVFFNESYFDNYNNVFDLQPYIHNKNINAVDTAYSVNRTVSSGLGTIDLIGQLQIKLVHNPQ